MTFKLDPHLLAWAHQVSRRHRRLPPLWLFTDSRRLPDPRTAVARLPRGLAGVVFRHDDDPARPALGRALAAICRQRRLAFVVAGDARLAAALGAGVHLRAGRRAGHGRPGRWPTTSSAHTLAEALRARRAGADLVFLSPVFATASHPEAAPLGVLRWAQLARRAGVPVAALGGMSGASIRRLPRRICHAIAAISALA